MHGHVLRSNAGRSHSIKSDSSTFERVVEFKYLGTTLTNQNSIQEEIKEQIEVRECLLSFGTESFVLPVLYPKYKDQHIQNYNFVSCCNLVIHFEEGT